MNFSPSWSTETALYSLVMTLSQCWNCMEVMYLPIYFPDEEEKANPRLYAANVQKLIADALEVPCSNYGLEEFPKEHVELRPQAGEEGWRQWELFKGDSPPLPRLLTGGSSPAISPASSPSMSPRNSPQIEGDSPALLSSSPGETKIASSDTVLTDDPRVQSENNSAPDTQSQSQHPRGALLAHSEPPI